MPGANGSIQFDAYDGFEVVQGTVSHSFPLHIHNSECYGVITGGRVELYCGTKKVLQKGDVFRIPRGVPHTLGAINGQPYSYRTVCVKHTDLFPSTDEFLRRAYDYILKRGEKPLDLEEMAGAMCYSKYYLVRRFKEKCGISPYQFYTNVRIEKIRQGLLLEQPLSDLAYACGFSHQSHLCRDFKRYMGVTPTEYQRSYHDYASAGVKTARIKSPCAPAVTLWGIPAGITPTVPG